MNKLLLHILLLFSGFYVSAQEETMAPPAADTIYTIGVPTVKTDTVAFVTDTAVAYTERTFKDKFQDKYTGEDYVYEKKAQAKSVWERFLEWLRELLDSIFSVGDGTKSSPVYDIVIRVVCAIIILAVVYFIARAIINKEGSLWIFGRSRKNINVHDVLEENIHQMNFSELIEQTKQAGDYRLGIRYYYLWLLKKMSNNALIDWHWDKTNTDYLYEIKDSRLRTDFEYLSYIYDYSWYGEFPIDAAAFAKAEKAFLKTIQTL